MNETYNPKASLIVSCLAAIALPAYSATISVSVEDADSENLYDLTNVYGTLDWAYTSENDINRKDGGSLIGTMPSSLSSAGNRPDYGFTFSDGTDPVSGTVTDPTFHNNDTFLSITAPSAGSFTIYFWGTAWNSVGTLTASINGASDAASITRLNDRSPGALFTILVDGANANDTVSIEYVQTESLGGFDSVAFTAVGVVPEPTTALLVSLGSLALLRRRRR